MLYTHWIKLSLNTVSHLVESYMNTVLMYMSEIEIPIVHVYII